MGMSWRMFVDGYHLVTVTNMKLAPVVGDNLRIGNTVYEIILVQWYFYDIAGRINALADEALGGVNVHLQEI